MRQKRLYNHGLPFSQKLAENLDKLIARVKSKKASLMVIDGGIGEGKTTLAIEAADYINKVNGINEVILKKKECCQLGLGGADFIKKLRICYNKKLPVIIYDEAGDFNKRGSLSRFNAMINRTFETFRAFQIIVILVLPSFAVLDQDIFDKQIPRLLLHLKDRNDLYGNFDAYSLYRMLLLRGRMKNMNIKNFAFTFIWPNFRGHFLDLTPQRSRELDKLSTDNKLSLLQKSEIEIDGLMNYSQIGNKLMRSIRWVKQVINKLKLKPARTIKRAKYFNEETVNILAEYLDTVSDQQRGEWRK